MGSYRTVKPQPGHGALRRGGAQMQGWRGLACLAALAAGAYVAPAMAGGECRIQGWSADRGGLRVRAAPSASAGEVGRLPPFVRNDDSDFGPGFDILEGRDGWLRIGRVTDGHGPAEMPPRRRFAGTGWVRGDAVQFAVQSGDGRAAPREDAPAVVSLPEDRLTEAGDVAGRDGLPRRLGAGTLPPEGRREGRGAVRGGSLVLSNICPDQRTAGRATPPP